MKIEKILGGLVSLGVVAALAVPLALAKSQDSPAPQAAGKEMGMRRGLQAAVESLNLTDDLAKVNAVLTPDQQTELKSKVEAAKTKPPSQP